MMSNSSAPPVTQDVNSLPLKRRFKFSRSLHERLSLSPSIRLPLITGLGLSVGTVLGASYGSQMAGLRFRAENAHRLPTSEKGWYLYHKSKNIVSIVGGIKEGAKMGGTVAFWVGTFVTLEEAMDTFRGGYRRRDFLSTVMAALATSGAFSLWNRFPLPTAARTAKMALKIGLIYGLGQDVLSLSRGRSLAYVDHLLGKI